MFRRKLVPTRESMRRAEEDGYKNFLNATKPESDEVNKRKKAVRRVYSAGIMINGKEPSRMQVGSILRKLVTITPNRFLLF